MSDNYPELAFKNEKSMILSNFFWHDILKINTNYYKKIEKKIAKRPIVQIIYFVLNILKKNLRFIQ